MHSTHLFTFLIELRIYNIRSFIALFFNYNMGLLTLGMMIYNTNL